MAYLSGSTRNASYIIADFTDAMRRRGLVPSDDLIADGRLHRCRDEGARSSKRDGAYVLHLDERPAGGFQNCCDGKGFEVWRYANGTVPCPAIPGFAGDRPLLGGEALAAGEVRGRPRSHQIVGLNTRRSGSGSAETYPPRDLDTRGSSWVPS